MSGAAGGGAFAGILIANNVALLQKGVQAAAEAWVPLATGGLELGTSLGRPVLKGAIDGTPIMVEIVNDLVYCAYTRVVATPPQVVGVTVGVYPTPPGVIGKLRALIGQDIEVGDPAFDPAFLVHGRPETAARSLLGPEIREHLRSLAARGLSAFDYEADRVCVQLAGVQTDPEVLRVAIELARLAALWRP